MTSFDGNSNQLPQFRSFERRPAPVEVSLVDTVPVVIFFNTKLSDAPQVAVFRTAEAAGEFIARVATMNHITGVIYKDTVVKG